MYVVFVIKTKRKSVSRGNSKITRKEMPKLFSCKQPSQFAEMCIRIASQLDEIDEIAGEEGNNKKKMIDFDHSEEYSKSILNKILLWQCQEKQIFIQLTFAG